jgi:hypothetical protein
VQLAESIPSETQVVIVADRAFGDPAWRPKAPHAWSRSMALGVPDDRAALGPGGWLRAPAGGSRLRTDATLGCICATAGGWSHASHKCRLSGFHSPLTHSTLDHSISLPVREVMKYGRTRRE